ncbi:uncharacterized protein LOC132613833 isoform X2 [Lycium barbarum]|uniref:uncharacterized protein LOC132613833 isoform X2 n=1 Tax=Lycium barbarum TaxID=112863 RepID=UPI00293E2D0F|nr:uncharacterized protein LOC132613833 isoform X2 [Lycium barbarum]
MQQGCELPAQRQTRCPNFLNKQDVRGGGATPPLQIPTEAAFLKAFQDGEHWSEQSSWELQRRESSYSINATLKSVRKALLGNSWRRGSFGGKNWKAIQACEGKRIGVALFFFF